MERLTAAWLSNAPESQSTMSEVLHYLGEQSVWALECGTVFIAICVGFTLFFAQQRKLEKMSDIVTDESVGNNPD